MVVDLLLGVAANMGFCVCSMFCCIFSCVFLCFAIILIGRESLLLLYFVFFWCLLNVMPLFLTVLWVSMQCVIVLFPDHTHVHFLSFKNV